MGSRPLLLSLPALILISSVALAADGPNVDRVTARAAYDEGARLYEVKEFRPALSAFKRAYVAWDNPAFLFNIAQCHRRLGERQEALDYFRNYLTRLPSAPDRGEVERYIAELEADLRARPETSPPTVVSAPVVVAAPTSPPPPRRRTRPWVWAVVGVGAAAAIGLGVGLGVGLTRASGDGFSPTLPDLHTLTFGGAR